MKAAKLETLRAEHADFIGRVKARGGRLLTLTTPCCETDMQVHVPSAARQQWDSLTICPGCGEMFMSVLTRDSAEGFNP